MDKKTRNDKLAISNLAGGDEKYGVYSTGKQELLRLLGNPRFGGEGEWDTVEELGVAWVIFTLPYKEGRKFLDEKDPREALRDIWGENMHTEELFNLNVWMSGQQKLVDAARTRAMENLPGKPDDSEEEGQETHHTG